MSNVPSSCAAYSSSRSERARWVALSIAVRVGLSMLGLLHNDLLAGADQPGASVTNAIKGALELLLGLDAAGAELREADADQPLAVHGREHLVDRGGKASRTRVAVSTNKRNRDLFLPVLGSALVQRARDALLEAGIE